MLIECWSVIIILLATCLVFLKSHRNQYVLPILPLGIPPFFHIIGAPFSRWLHAFIPLSYSELAITIDVVALLLSTLLLLLVSRPIQKKKARWSFVVCCSIFNILLAAVLIETNIIW